MHSYFDWNGRKEYIWNSIIKLWHFTVWQNQHTSRAMRSDPKPITIFLTDDMLSIIDKWGNKDKSPDNFIFLSMSNLVKTGQIMVKNSLKL